MQERTTITQEPIVLLVINPVIYQLVMCRFLEFVADIIYIPSGVIFYHAVKPNEKFGLLLLI